ncbi:hypothetical protein AB0K00_46160 [Dactylosporangium sp. NPDC049525]|uniref:hypothetical protein n=1 Tax=Dactylosporangium sp. NPDC049525 TaxID=3154730 RepID=UPI00342F61A2
MDGEMLFWELAEALLADAAVSRSTMMGLPFLRYESRFFASLDRRSGALLVKLAQPRVAELIGAGTGEPFAPAGRTFREWLAVPAPDRSGWRALLAEALAFAGGSADLAAGRAPHAGGFCGSVWRASPFWRGSNATIRRRSPMRTARYCGGRWWSRRRRWWWRSACCWPSGSRRVCGPSVRVGSH